LHACFDDCQCCMLCVLRCVLHAASCKPCISQVAVAMSCILCIVLHTLCVGVLCIICLRVARVLCNAHYVCVRCAAMSACFCPRVLCSVHSSCNLCCVWRRTSQICWRTFCAARGGGGRGIFQFCNLSAALGKAGFQHFSRKDPARTYGSGPPAQRKDARGIVLQTPQASKS